MIGAKEIVGDRARTVRNQRTLKTWYDTFHKGCPVRQSWLYLKLHSHIFRWHQPSFCHSCWIDASRHAMMGVKNSAKYVRFREQTEKSNASVKRISGRVAYRGERSNFLRGGSEIEKNILLSLSTGCLINSTSQHRRQAKCTAVPR